MSIEKAINQRKFHNPVQKVVINIGYTQSYINSVIHHTLKPYTLSPEQYNVLRILRGVSPNAISTKVITERMINKMSNASRLVEKLRIKKLVSRQISKEDKRLVDVVITAKGLKLLDTIDEVINNMENIFGHMDVEELNTLNNLLDKLRYPNE